MADQLHNSTVNAAIIPEVWSSRFYQVLRTKLPFLVPGVIDKSYEGEISALGDIVNITTISDFSDATELPEGAKGDAEATTMTGQQLTINKRTYKDFMVTKRAQLQSLSHMDSLREKAVFAIQKRMQQVIIDNIVPSASTPDHAISYDLATTLALADLLEGKELLDTADVPMEDRQAVMGSAAWNDMFNITGFVSRDFIPAGSPLTSGTFNTPVLGFTPRLTTAVSTTTYLFHPEFLTMAIQQQLNVETEYVADSRVWRVSSDILWGLKQLGNTRVVSIS